MTIIRCSLRDDQMGCTSMTPSFWSRNGDFWPQSCKIQVDSLFVIPEGMGWLPGVAKNLQKLEQKATDDLDDSEVFAEWKALSKSACTKTHGRTWDGCPFQNKQSQWANGLQIGPLSLATQISNWLWFLFDWIISKESLLSPNGKARVISFEVPKLREKNGKSSKAGDSKNNTMHLDII